MGVGGVFFGATALLGLQGVLHAVPLLYWALKVMGGLYLCYLGFLILRSARQPLAMTASACQTGTAAGSFLLGLTTQVSNPKTAIVYASVFAAFLPGHVSTAFATALLLVVFFVETSWYGLVAVLLSSTRPQRAYLSYKKWVDRTAGFVMVGLGLKLVAGATKP